jgi:hypothetical protein
VRAWAARTVKRLTRHDTGSPYGREIRQAGICDPASSETSVNPGFSHLAHVAMCVNRPESGLTQFSGGRAGGMGIHYPDSARTLAKGAKKCIYKCAGQA